MTRTILACLVLSTSALSAQQQPLAGVWDVSYPAGMRMINGEATPIMASGVLTVVVHGDSLIAQLAANASPEMPARPPTRLAARAAGAGEVVFASRSEATINMHGEEQKATVLSTGRVAVQSDSLVGTVERRIEGHEMGNSGPQPVTGVRAKR
jgi:hypothetical protein